jgi:drug/metabolite transporter (DMT)-like permease
MRNARLVIPAILAMAFWATNFVFSPSVIAAVGAIQLTGARWFIALVILIPLALVREKTTARVVLGEWKIHFVQALMGSVGYTLLLYYALGVSSPVSAAILVSLNPACIAIAARFFLKEQLSTRAVMGFAVSFVGALVVVLGIGVVGTFTVSYGDVMVFLATLLWTAYSLVAPRVQTPPMTATAVQSGISAIVMIPVMVIDIALGNSAWLNLGRFDWLAIVWIGLMPSAGAYVLWNISSELIGPTRTGSFLNLIPVFTTVLVIALGGTVTPMQLVGGLLVLLGISVANQRAQAAKVTLA